MENLNQQLRSVIHREIAKLSFDPDSVSNWIVTPGEAEKHLVAAVAQAIASGRRTETNDAIILCRQEGDRVAVTLGRPDPSWTAQKFGILICTLVKHVATVFAAPEEEVWKHVDDERESPKAVVEQWKVQ